MTNSEAPEDLWTALNLEGVTAQNSEAFAAADLNADDTSTDEGFALFSPRWFEIFNLTYGDALDRGLPCSSGRTSR